LKYNYHRISPTSFPSPYRPFSHFPAHNAPNSGHCICLTCHQRPTHLPPTPPSFSLSFALVLRENAEFSMGFPFKLLASLLKGSFLLFSALLDASILSLHEVSTFSNSAPRIFICIVTKPTNLALQKNQN